MKKYWKDEQYAQGWHLIVLIMDTLGINWWTDWSNL